MNTDTFTEAARAEAERRHPVPEIETGAQLGYTQTQIREVVRRTFTNAAEWARTHLAAQEPTDAEVEAAANAIIALVPGETEETAHMDDIDEAWDHARAALVAARDVGQEERRPWSPRSS